MNNNVYALTVYDDGNGPALYVGGIFTSAGGAAANRIARWNGSTWTPLGSLNNDVHALAVHDDGCGSALYAGGAFTSAGGAAANRIARWNGSTWSPLGGGFPDPVRALGAYDDGCEPALYAGGEFLSGIDSGDSYMARWAGDTRPPELACPKVVFAEDRLTPGEVVTYSVTASDCLDPAPTLVCIPPSGSFFPRGTTTVTCTATDVAGNSSSCTFEVVVQIKPVRPR